MRKSFLLLLSIAFVIPAWGQYQYKKGYFVNSAGTRTDCEVQRNWDTGVTNPVSIKYRLVAGGEVKEIGMADMNEFGVEGIGTFFPMTVQLDRSSDMTSKLTNDRQPDFKTETVVLNRIVDGQADLYEFLDGGLKKYFYQSQAVPVQQLVYKRYLAMDANRQYETGNVSTNDQYKQQLLNNLKCAAVTQKEIEGLRYDRSSLGKLFEKYNRCMAGETITESPAPSGKSLRLRAGASYSHLTTPSSSTYTDVFESRPSFRFGFETEVMIKKDPNWSIPITADFEMFSTKSTTQDATFDLKSINVGLSVRRYLPLSEKTKLYANAGIFYGFSFGETAKRKYLGFSSYYTAAVKPGFGYTGGVGVLMGNLSIELNYLYRIFNEKSAIVSYEYSGPGILLSYKISN